MEGRVRGLEEVQTLLLQCYAEGKGACSLGVGSGFENRFRTGKIRPVDSDIRIFCVYQFDTGLWPALGADVSKPIEPKYTKMNQLNPKPQTLFVPESEAKLGLYTLSLKQSGGSKGGMKEGELKDPYRV